MTKISVLGVTIGVATLVVVLSIMGGLENNLRKKMFQGMPHLEIFAENTLAGFSLQEVSLPSLKKIPSVIHAEPFIQSDVVIKKDKNIAPITLFGLDHDQGGKLWTFSENIIEGSLDSINEAILKDYGDEDEGGLLPGIILGEGIALRIGANYGDIINLLNPQMNMGTMLGGAKGSSLFQVRGTFYTSLPKYDNKYALVVLGEARKFMPDYDSYLDEEDFVTGIALNVSYPNKVDVYKQKIESSLGLKVRTWKDANKSLIFALKLEKYTMGAILLLIVLVAAFSISGTLMMSVFYKRSQISILSSLGLSQKSVLWLHLAHGFTIGFVGALGGLVFGVAACFLVDSNLLNHVVPEFLYAYLSNVPIKFLPIEYIVISSSAWFLSLLAAVYPAIVAAKQPPSDGLRYL